jgi:hypothetical protein
MLDAGERPLRILCGATGIRRHPARCNSARPGRIGRPDCRSFAGVVERHQHLGAKIYRNLSRELAARLRTTSGALRALDSAPFDDYRLRRSWPEGGSGPGSFLLLAQEKGTEEKGAPNRRRYLASS